MKPLLPRLASALCSAWVLASVSAALAADPLTDALQQGLLAEEVQRDLPAAVQAYETAVREADAQRQAAATAVFRLAETYRKLGRTNDAVVQYRRILDQFADQAPLIALCRTNLGLLAPGTPPTPTSGRLTPAAQQQKELLQQELALVEEQLRQKQLLADAGRVSRDELITLQREALAVRRQIIALESQVRVDLLDVTVPPAAGSTVPPTATPALPSADPEDVAALREEFALVEQEFKATQARVQNGKADPAELRRTHQELLRLRRQLPENADALRQTALLQESLQVAEEGLAEVRRKIEVGAAAPLDEVPLRRQVLGLQRELRAVQRAGIPLETTTHRVIPPPATPEEAAEIQRILALIRDSPDLVSARNATPTGGTPLHKAAASGYLAVTEYLLAIGADVNAQDSQGDTALMLAAAAGHKRLGELLLAKGADVNAANRTAYTALHRAVLGGYLALAETLIAAGAQVNTRGYVPPPNLQPKEGEPNWALMETTPLHSAAEKGFPALVELLLKNNAELEARDRGGRTPLLRAVLALQPATARVLLERGADANVEDSDERSPLAHAVAQENTALTQLLLDHQADPEVLVASGNNDFGWTALFEPVGQGRVELARLLLDGGANVNAEGTTGLRPVHWAVIQNASGTLALLLDRKADVNLRDTGGNTPLHHAIYLGSLPSVQALLAAGADPNAAGFAGAGPFEWPPLLAAIGRGDRRPAAIVEGLLKAGADVNRGLTNGWTALHRAVQQERADLVSLLLTNGAAVNVRGTVPDDEPQTGARYSRVTGPPPGPEAAGPRPIPMAAGMPSQFGVRFGGDADGPHLSTVQVTPLHVAASVRSPALIRLLLGHGAEVNARDAAGCTPLHVAVKRRNLECLRVLLDAKADPNVRDNEGRTPLQWAAATPSMRSGYQRDGVLVWEAEARELEALLRERGARPLSASDAITVSRSSTGFTVKAVSRGRQDWNRFTLLEVLAFEYGFLVPVGLADITGLRPLSNHPLAFPDLARLRIIRPTPQGDQVIPVDLAAALNLGDCSGDVLLEWGDVIEVPEEDHPLNATWQPSDPLRELLRKCLERTVTIVIKGTPQPYSLKLPYQRSPDGKRWVEDGKSRRSGWDVRTVLEQSGLLRLSSDRTAVKVSRVDPNTGAADEWTVDCTPGPATADLWLRNGDVIDVPERPAPAPEVARLPPIPGAHPVEVRVRPGTDPEGALVPPVPGPEGAEVPPIPGTGVVRVLGEVKRPGTVPLDAGREKDIIDAIAESGGLTENARPVIEFTRNGQTQTLLWEQLKAEADPAQKITLRAGDLIEVKRRVF